MTEAEARAHPCEVCGQPAKLVQYVRRRGATFVGIATHWYCDKHTGSTPYDNYKTSVFGGYIMLILSMFTVLALFHATKIEGENIKGLWLFLLVSGFFSVLTWYFGARLNY